jgi:hypothetical protein
LRSRQANSLMTFPLIRESRMYARNPMKTTLSTVFCAITAALLLFTSGAAGQAGEDHLSPAGPLRICVANPRYFADPSGRPVYLTGSHTCKACKTGSCPGTQQSLSPLTTAVTSICSRRTITISSGSGGGS